MFRQSRTPSLVPSNWHLQVIGLHGCTTPVRILDTDALFL